MTKAQLEKAAPPSGGPVMRTLVGAGCWALVIGCGAVLAAGRTDLQQPDVEQRSPAADRALHHVEDALQVVGGKAHGEL
jgi:hypothetical protein